LAKRYVTEAVMWCFPKRPVAALSNLAKRYVTDVVMWCFTNGSVAAATVSAMT